MRAICQRQRQACPTGHVNGAGLHRGLNVHTGQRDVGAYTAVDHDTVRSLAAGGDRQGRTGVDGQNAVGVGIVCTLVTTGHVKIAGRRPRGLHAHRQEADEHGQDDDSAANFS